MHTIKWKYENAIFTLGKENLSAEDCLKVFEKPVTSLSWKKSYWTNTSRIDYLRITQAITSSQTTPAPMSQKVKRDMLYSEAFKQSPKNFISMFVIITMSAALAAHGQCSSYILKLHVRVSMDQRSEIRASSLQVSKGENVIFIILKWSESSRSWAEETPSSNHSWWTVSKQETTEQRILQPANRSDFILIYPSFLENEDGCVS